MASLSNNNGLRTIAFDAPGGGRKWLRLGRLPSKAAETIRTHVNHLLVAAESRLPVDAETARWLGGIGDDLYSRLVKVGLVAQRADKPKATLGLYFDGYIAGRTDLKPRTIENLKQTRRSLVDFFTESRDLATINKAEARDWQRKALETYAPATVATFTKKARQVFADAADRGIVAANPFVGLKAGRMDNADRQAYVPASVIEKVIEACPDARWRLLFALARYGSLRVPSETALLEWALVDFDTLRMTVRSPKTEHHAGRESRTVPICPELLTRLRDAFELAEPGETHALGVLRHTANPSTTGEKIVRRAGLTAWPKLWQNLRSSCETDWTARFPLHVACAWAGNTQAVALRHYLQVTDEHFAAAVGEGAAKSAADSSRQGVTGGDTDAVETKKPPQMPGASTFTYPQGESNSPEITVENLRNGEQALQKALQTLHSALPKWRERAIANLASAVAGAGERSQTLPRPGVAAEGSA